MSVPSKACSREIFLKNDRGKKIFHAVTKAWRYCCENYSDRGRWRRKSTFRHLVWEFSIIELEKAFSDDKGVRLVGHKDTVSFIVDDVILFRFKHADNGLKTANFPTNEARSFHDHDADLYGFKGLQRIELCYIPNEFGTELIWVGFSAHLFDKMIWKIELSDKGELEPRFSFFSDEPERDTRDLVRLKETELGQNDKSKKDNG